MAAPVTESLVQTVAEMERQRLVAVGKAWDAFYGKHPKPLLVKHGRPDDNVIVNLCRLVVLKSLAALFGKGVDWDIDDTEDTQEEEWLDAVAWGRRKSALLKGYGLDGGVTGHPFYRIRIEGMAGGRPKPRIIVLDPATVFPQWEPDDFEKVYQYRVQYTGLDTRGAVAVTKTYRQLIDLNDNEQAWTITDQVSTGNNANWVTVGEPEQWPYPFPPIVHNQNLPNTHEFWGLADLESDTIQLNYGINNVVSNMAKIVRLWSHPRTIAQGISGTTPIDTDPSGIIKLSGNPSEARMYTLEMSGDLSAAREFLSGLREFFHEVARIPEVATGKVDNIGQLSGLAMQILYEPLVELTEDKQETYGEALEDLNKRLLVIGGWRRPDEEYDITLHWPEVIPTDAESEAQGALVLEQLGVSRDTLLTKLGFDPELETTKKATEQDAMGSAVLDAFNAGTSQQPAGQMPMPGMGE